MTKHLVVTEGTHQRIKMMAVKERCSINDLIVLMLDDREKKYKVLKR